MSPYIVTERIYLTSNKRVVVPEGDLRARFLLACKGKKLTKAEAERIQKLRNGAAFLSEDGKPPPAATAEDAPKGDQPDADKSGQPEGDKSGQPAGDKSQQPGADKSGQPAGDKSGQESLALLGPDDLVPAGKHKGKLVRELTDSYLKNVVRADSPLKQMAEAELARREKEQS